ncbi:hydrolase [Streptomyces phage Kenrey]|nr:hydrolase [Streptomyces phage Kenrey]
MKRTFATLATVLAVAGTTSFVVVESNTERPVVAADSQSDRGEEDHRASRNETRQPLTSPAEEMAQMKRAMQKAQAEKLERERIAAEKRAKEEAARKEAARKAEAQRRVELAAAAEKARKQREANSKPRVYKPKVQQPRANTNNSNNHVAPGGIAACIRKYESGGNYRALNPSSGASGAYQFMDGTWQSVTGLPGKAMNYSPAQQDAAFWKLWNNGRGASHWVTAPKCGY